MVLDHSKISVFSRSGEGAKQSAEDYSRGIRGPADPLSNIYSSVDIAVITEEVIEGIATGHLARGTANKCFTNVGSPFLNPKYKAGMQPLSQCEEESLRPSVEIVLDLAPMQDWRFVTQPGALRRVLMNLFGNALKYTPRGFVKIQLRSAPSSPETDTQPPATVKPTLVTLTVEDSGNGISQEYLRTRLYTAFAQENTLAAGTGLGLSLVKSIVTMLNGTIEVTSEVGVGTTFNVTIPMVRCEKAAKTEQSDPAEYVEDEDLVALRKEERKPQVCIFERSPHQEMAETAGWNPMLRHSLCAYLTEWFEFPPLQS